MKEFTFKPAPWTPFPDKEVRTESEISIGDMEKAPQSWN